MGASCAWPVLPNHPLDNKIRPTSQKTDDLVFAETCTASTYGSVQEYYRTIPPSKKYAARINLQLTLVGIVTSFSTSAEVIGLSANVSSWLKADIQSPEIEVRFAPKSRHSEAHAGLPLLTQSGRKDRWDQSHYLLKKVKFRRECALVSRHDRIRL